MTEIKILRAQLAEASKTARLSAQFWESLTKEDREKLEEDSENSPEPLTF